MRLEKFVSIILLVAALEQVAAFQTDDEECDKQLSAFSEDLKTRKLWALKLFDLWGKLDAGYFSGNNRHSVGRFNECLNFTESPEDLGTVQGQYCLVKWSAKSTNSSISEYSTNSLNFTLDNGICLPATCSPDKVIEFTNFLLDQSDYEAFDARCQTKDPLPFDNIDIAAISLLSIFGILLVASTAYDMIARRITDKSPQKFLIAFSVYTNGRRLFTINRSEPSKTIGCLEGLRCISIICIVCAQRFTLQFKAPNTNNYENLERSKHWWNALFHWQFYCFDTFLVIGGFLSALQLLDAFEKKTFKALRLAIHRYVRYTPMLVTATIIFMSIARHVKAPYPDIEGLESCHRYWWSTLLHLQNYINPENVCPSHSWYLSVDFQLFVLSPLLIYPARHYGWKYLWNLPALAITSSLSVMMTSLANGFTPLSNAERIFALVNIPTHARIAPWLFGLVLGYVIYESKGRDVKLNKSLVVLLWILSVVVLASLIAVENPINKLEDNQITRMQFAIIRGFGDIAWSLPISWIIFACYKLKSGGFVLWLLSLREWQPLGRLTLGIYVTHLFYQRFSLMIEKAPLTNEVLPTFITFLGDFMVCLILGTIFWLTFEAPFVQIERYFFNRPQTIYKVKEHKTREAIRNGNDIAL